MIKKLAQLAPLRKDSRRDSRRDNPLLQVRIPAWRSHASMVVMSLAFLALAGRTAYLQLVTTEYLQQQGESRYMRTLDLPATRGKILDRNGVVLASSLPAKAIWAIPEDVDASKAKLKQLAALLAVSEADLKKKLANDDRSFVYLKRQVDADIAEKIAKLQIEGIHQRKEYKRYYPEGESLAHVVGFTNTEDLGVEGIERGQQGSLAGRSGSRRVIKDRMGRVIEDIEAVREPFDGKDIDLSIDSKVQYLAFAAVRDAVASNRAKAGSAVVLDVRTGEVLALANWPTYNPNQRGRMIEDHQRNRALTDVFEPGSTMKPFTAALALELGKFKPHTVIATAPGKLVIGNRTIGDAHPHGDLTVEQVIQKSSNVGTAKMAMTMQAQELWGMYNSLGFGHAPNLGFPGTRAGVLRPHKNWRAVEQATMSYGHGLSVSLLQMARAYTVFARDGDLIPLTLSRTGQPVDGVRVMKPQTAKSIRKMLEMSVAEGGTAPLANVEGFRVAGKTGTSHKIEGGVYVNKYVSSFVGFAPASDPRVVIAVMIDEPSAGKYYAGEVAAPVFSRITGDVLRTLRVQPDAPFRVQLDKPVEAVKESV
jgi:cell division protein FtsI (penicillin-binding protein 3)